MSTSPILVVGSGAIGAIAGVNLLANGYDVHFVDANADHVAAVQKTGLRLSGVADTVVTPKIMLPEQVTDTYDTILLAVKARHTADALPVVARSLSADGCVVSLQNGLEEYKIAEAIGAQRTIGAYLTFGGYVVEAGHVKNGGGGSFKIGEIDGALTPRIHHLAEMLFAVHPVAVTDNIFGYLWAKMALGAVYFGTAVSDMDVVAVYDRPRAREVLARLCGEVVAVADARGINIEQSDGFDPQAFRNGGTDAARMDASWEAQRRYWGSHDNARTGVWRDLAIFRRPTEVDYQLTPVIEIGRQAGVTTPYLEALHRLVKDIEAARAPLSVTAL